jgi:hypothetical protein
MSVRVNERRSARKQNNHFRVLSYYHLVDGTLVTGSVVCAGTTTANTARAMMQEKVAWRGKRDVHPELRRSAN